MTRRRPAKIGKPATVRKRESSGGQSGSKKNVVAGYEGSDLRSLAAILEQVHDSVIFTDLVGNITGWNHGAEKIFAYKSKEVLGKNVALLYFEEDRANVAANVLDPLKKRGKLEVELRNRRKSGEECFVRLSLSLLRDETNQPHGMLGVAIDITEQRRAQLALQENEEKYRSLADALPQIAYTTNADGKTVFINKHWEQYSGARIDDSLALEWLSWIHPDDTAYVMKSWVASLASATAFEAEYRVRRRDGQYRWHLSRAVPMQGPDGHIRQWIGTLADIHDQKVRESQRATLERDTLQAILENLTEAILVAKPDGTIVLMNRAAQRMYAISGDSVDELTIAKFAGTTEARNSQDVPLSLTERPLARAMRGECFTDCEIRFRHKRTGRQWIGSCSGIPVFSQDGQLSLAVLTIRDVTSERKTAGEIQNANSILRDLSAQLLRLQDDERKRISRELHDGTVQILSGALINLTMLSQSKELENLPFEHRLVCKSLELISSSATELRTMSYLLYPPVLDELGLVPALRTWADGFSERTGITLDLQLEESDIRLAPVVEAALFRITQEALANVHRHSRSNTASVRLSIFDDNVELSISDNGCGFNAQRIFSAAQTVQLGVGLPGMRERARELGGQLVVKSTAKGTRIKVILPRKDRNV